MTEMPATFFRYETNADGTFHLWACIAEDRSFAVHVWARKVLEGRWDRREWFGGVEQHASPLICKRPVDRGDCEILGGRCCHDGSSEAFHGQYSRVEYAITSGNIAAMFPRVAYIFKERWNMMQESRS